MRLSLIFVLCATGLLAQHTYTAADVEDGGRSYRANCVTCHGPDGDKIPNADLSRGKFRRASNDASSDDELVNIILKGIPGTAMGPNESMPDFQAVTIVAYLRSLATAPSRRSALEGDPGRGKALFENKGGCLACHRVKTAGSRVGPNLTDVGGTRRAVELERALVSPSADVAPQNRSIRVVTKDGSTITGRLLNIDTFSIQLLDSNESLRSFSRSDLRESTILGKSTMPSYQDKLSAQELADVVSYLGSLRGIEK